MGDPPVFSRELRHDPIMDHEHQGHKTAQNQLEIPDADPHDLPLRTLRAPSGQRVSKIPIHLETHHKTSPPQKGLYQFNRNIDLVHMCADDFRVDICFSWAGAGVVVELFLECSSIDYQVGALARTGRKVLCGVGYTSCDLRLLQPAA